MAVDGDDLPSPQWLVEEGETIREEFPVWTDEDALTFIIGQKYKLFPALRNLERIDPESEPPDLYTIERRISWTGYGPDDIMEDLNGLPDYITRLWEAKIKKIRDYRCLLRSAKLLLDIVGEELEKFKSCADCVAYYYNTNNYFTVPCRKLHSVVYVKKCGAMWPAKTIRVKDEKVLVAYFGHFGKSNSVHQHEWVKFSLCTMASTCFLYEITGHHHKAALMEMGVYIRMIARKLNRYYKGFPCHGKYSTREAITFKPEYLTIPDDLLSSEPPNRQCSSCHAPIEKVITIPLVPKRSKQVKKPKINDLTAFTGLNCARIGCSKVATRKILFSEEVHIAFCSECVKYF